MKRATHRVDVLVIGAGPAGLAAAHALRRTPLSTLVIDAGKRVSDRDRELETDITRGHGGAGLFSDGKFSFYPSASALWSLPHHDHLRDAYDWACSVLRGAGLDTPPFPDDPAAYSTDAGAWVLKQYPSDYLSLQARLDLTSRLVAESGAEVWSHTTVVDLLYDPELEVFRATTRNTNGVQGLIEARRVVLASGRFGPLGLKNLVKSYTWRRLELGFRIEQPAQEAFFGAMPQLDPKLSYRSEDGRVEWRTFCACRQGEAVATETEGLWTVSGRADCPSTGRSNIGFNTRILDESVAERTFPYVLTAMHDEQNRFQEDLIDFLRGAEAPRAVFTRVYGQELADLMRQGLKHLVRRFPQLLTKRTKLIGPTLEGVGWYPDVEPDLRLRDAPAWVAGDSCGLFRGIVAAMISGHYVASVLSESYPVDLVRR